VLLAAIVAIALLAPSTAFAQMQSITTIWNRNNAQGGIMFDIVAKTNIRLVRVDHNIRSSAPANPTVEIWTRPGTHVGFQNSSTGWTRVGSDIVTHQGENNPTPVGVDLSSITMAPGERRALYITLVSGSTAYTNGTTVGTLHTSNAHVEIYQGTGKSYPFASNFIARIWNGTLYYTTGGCTIGGVPYADGASHPTNACLFCNATANASAWSNRPANYACPTDNLGCTGDICNGSGTCTHPVNAGWCVINNACVAENTQESGNSCKACLPGTSTTAYSNRPSGATCATDHLGCTDNVCDGAGTCEHPLLTGCLIGDVCIAENAWDPFDSCKACLPGESTSSYSLRPPGSVCEDDGNSWTDNICDQSHVCTHPPTDACEIDGVPMPNWTENPFNDCEWCNSFVSPTEWTPKPSGEACADDTLSCTTNVCDGSGSCTHPINPGWCVIGKTCIAEDTPEGTDSCRACLPGTSTSSYSNRPNGTPCDADPYSCTDDICNGSGTCTHPIVTGCLIGTLCVAEDAWDLENSCLACISEESKTAYSVRPVGSECADDGILWTLNECNDAGVCTHEPSGNCAIDGFVIENGTVNGATGCEICNSSENPTDWTLLPAGTPCPEDGPGWTEAVCDGAGTCIHEPTGQCEIDGVIFENGDINPENFCLWCNSSASASHWSPRSKGSYCMDDSLDCTLDVCDGAGQCEHIVYVGCLIAGTCVADRESDPGNVCLECNARYRTDDYSPKANGESCDPNGACDGSGHCWPRPTGTCTVEGVEYANGASNPLNDCQRCDSTVDPDGWVYRAKGASCGDDSLSCTSKACDGAGTCSTKVVFGCLIEDECVAPGVKAPEDACLECNPALSTEGYSASPKGSVCEDDDDLRTQDLCDGLGTCLHQPKGACEIDGFAVDAGSINPNNGCQWCDPSASESAWSDRPNGSICAGDGLTCTNDVCVAGVCEHNLYEGCLIDGGCVGIGAVPLGVDCMECSPEDPEGYSLKKPGEVCSSEEGDPTMLDVCDGEGTCTHSNKGTCVIDGKGWPEGAGNPANECEWCAPNTSSDSWTPRATGYHCATDHLDCTVDACTAGNCGHTLVQGNCLIGDHCMGKGAQNSSEPCEVCDPDQKTTEYVWSEVPACNPCQSNEDCDPGEKCEEGECVPIPPPRCEDDDECPGDEKCVDNTCQKVPPPPCVDDADCDDDQTCQDGECVAIPPERCEDDDECGEGRKCENGECVAIPPEGCNSDEECGPGEKCGNGICQVIPECEMDSQCNGGVCIAGKCNQVEAMSLAGGGCKCGVVGAGGLSSASGFGALVMLLGTAMGLRLRRRAR